MSDPAKVAVLSTGLATIIFFAVAYFIYRLVRRGIALLLKGVDLQVPPIALLVSFALAATIFSTGAGNLWGLVLGIVQVFFVEVPRAIVEMSYTSYACGESMSRSSFSPGSDCFLRMGGSVANSIQRLFSRSLTYLDRVISLVQFFAAWALLAWCIGDLVSRSETEGTSKGLRRLIADMPAATRSRFGLGGVIVIAAYLCFCAIVAVSLFKPVEKVELLDHKALEDGLTRVKLSDSEEKKSFSLRFPEELGNLPGKKDQEEPGKLSGKKGQGDPGNLPENQEEQRLASAYGELVDLWKQQRGRVAAEQDRLVQRAIAAYRIQNLNRVGSREQGSHFLALHEWTQSSLARLFADLDGCRLAILRVRWVASTTSSGRSGAVGPDVSPAVRQEPFLERRADPSPGGIRGVPVVQPAPWLDSSNVARDALGTCERSTKIEDPPYRSDFGYTLGLVGDLSIWLLRTESMQLALITGLIGFGLLGALISTFVRTPTGQNPQLDIFGVVCRGVSAAIVVFLAAYAGIAIVSQASGDPNPYVVFVTCLVGSVFADNIWSWAKKKFLPTQNGADDNTKSTPADKAGDPTGGTGETTGQGASGIEPSVPGKAAE